MITDESSISEAADLNDVSRQNCSFDQILYSAKVLHHLFYINISPKILQTVTARKIDYFYWQNTLVMTADRRWSKQW